MRRNQIKKMKIYEAKLVYNAKESNLAGNILDTPGKSAEFAIGIYNSLFESGELDPTKEAFIVIAVNRKNRVLGYNIISIGTLNSTLAHPREIFKYLCLQSAGGLICVHNHPSGDPTPSQADINLTRKIRECAKVMEIDFLDHIVVGDKENDPIARGYYSFRDAGLA